MRSWNDTARTLRIGFHRTIQRCWPVPFGSRDRTGQVEDLHRCLFVREMAMGVDDLPESGIQGLDRVGRAQQVTDLDIEIHERYEAIPRGTPGFTDRRISPGPFLVEHLERGPRAASAFTALYTGFRSREISAQYRFDEYLKVFRIRCTRHVCTIVSANTT
jgi:hypothetical protein